MIDQLEAVVRDGYDRATGFELSNFPARRERRCEVARLVAQYGVALTGLGAL